MGVINFGNEFGNSDIMDEFLGYNLVNDDNVMSSMLNLLILGYNDLIYRKENNIRGNFFKPDESNDINSWKKSNNSVMQFVEECCEINNVSMVSSRGLYNYYKNEWNLGGNKMSEKKFISMVKESYELETKIKRKNGKQLRCILGLKCIDCSDSNHTININNKFVNF